MSSRSLAELGVDEIGLVLDELGPGHRQVGLILIHDDLIGFRVDLCAELTLVDAGVVVAAQGIDRARDIGSDLHGDHRVDGSAGGDGRDDVSARDRRGEIFDRARRAEPPCCTEDNEQGEGRSRTCHPAMVQDPGAEPLQPRRRPTGLSACVQSLSGQ